jgi:hypothetical protein
VAIGCDGPEREWMKAAMQKEMLALKDSLLSAILTGAGDLSVCLAQPSLMALLLAMASFAVTQKGETGDAQSARHQSGKSMIVESIANPTRIGIAAHPRDGSCKS